MTPRSLLLVAVLLAPMIASADPAAALFEEGRALLQQGKPPEACAKFQASLELDPGAAGVLLNLGLCNVQQHKVATALRWFRKAQTAGAAAGIAEVENAARQQVLTLSALVPTIRIDAPAGATVTIDGVAITDRSRIEIDAGHHVAGLTGVAQPFEVADDPSHTQLVVLRPPVPETVAVDPGAPRRHAAWVVGGIGAGLVVATGVVGLVGRSQFDGTHDLATRQRWKSIVEIGGTTMFVAGCAALGTAAVLYMTAPHAERATVVPVAAPDQVGLAVTGAF